MCVCVIVQSLKEEFENKRFVWKMVEDVERPRVVSAKIAPLMDKDNLYAQLVVRMHTKQVIMCMGGMCECACVCLCVCVWVHVCVCV